jgi:hypothetical protein
MKMVTNLKKIKNIHFNLSTNARLHPATCAHKLIAMAGAVNAWYGLVAIT